MQIHGGLYQCLWHRKHALLGRKWNLSTHESEVRAKQPYECHRNYGSQRWNPSQRRNTLKQLQVWSQQVGRASEICYTPWMFHQNPKPFKWKKKKGKRKENTFWSCIFDLKRGKGSELVQIFVVAREEGQVTRWNLVPGSLPSTEMKSSSDLGGIWAEECYRQSRSRLKKKPFDRDPGWRRNPWVCFLSFCKNKQEWKKGLAGYFSLFFSFKTHPTWCLTCYTHVKSGSSP